MARASKVETCMFCGDTPCTCNAKVTKPRRTRAPIAKEIEHSSQQELPAEKADVASVMRAAAKIKHVGATVSEEAESVDEISAIKEDPELAAAIRAVEPLMHVTERKRFAEVLNSEPDPKERALVWRRRVTGDG